MKTVFKSISNLLHIIFYGALLVTSYNGFEIPTNQVALMMSISGLFVIWDMRNYTWEQTQNAPVTPIRWIYRGLFFLIFMFAITGVFLYTWLFISYWLVMLGMVMVYYKKDIESKKLEELDEIQVQLKELEKLKKELDEKRNKS